MTRPIPRRAPVIPPALHEKYSLELEQLLDEQDDLKSKKKAVNKAIRGELELIADSIQRVRLHLKGITGAQVEIPGTELGPRRRDPIVDEVLRAAARVRDAQAELENAHPDAKAELRVGGAGGSAEANAERPHHRGPGRPRRPKLKDAASSADFEGSR